jgi:hypothetical protein
MRSHKQIIELWPNRADFARDVDVSYQTARQWHARDGIPVRYWPAVIEAARERGLDGVTLEVLVASKAAAGAESSVDETHAEENVQQDDGTPCPQGELELQAAE